MSMRPIYFTQHHGPADTNHIGTANMRGKLVQQAYWAKETAVEEHGHVVIKLASDSDSSPDIDSVFGLRAYKISLY